MAKKSSASGGENKKKTTKSTKSSKSTKSTRTKSSANSQTSAEKAIVSAAKAVAKSNNTALKVFAVLLVVAIVALCVYGYFAGWFDVLLTPPTTSGGGVDFNAETYDVTKISQADLSVHFLELGNEYTGDSIYIRAGQTDILIDGGSRTNSANTIEKYVNQYCTDGKLEYVIATHADQDHISSFAGDKTNKSLLERFEVGTLIDFALTNKNSAVYNNYLTQRNKLSTNGTTNVYTALQCVKQTDGAQKVYTFDNGVTMEVLEHKFYTEKSSDENNYSVCLLFSQGDSHYLFTGDLEKEGENSLVEMNPDLPKCVLFKAGHHGSKTSSNDVLLQKVQPDIVCVCCCAGSDEYKALPENTFPTQAFVDRVAKYTSNVYVTTLATEDGYTSMNGNIVLASSATTDESGKVVNNYKMYFSNNSTPLKDTDWFKNNRATPSQWEDKQ